MVAEVVKIILDGDPILARRRLTCIVGNKDTVPSSKESGEGSEESDQDWLVAQHPQTPTVEPIELSSANAQAP
nr:hypothetical protein Iba_scaffold32260CG0010 [Ipomoea batatas]